MTDYPKFKNAPITEALIDIQVTLPSGFQADRLLKIHEKIKDKFPLLRNNIIGNLEIRNSESGLPELPPTSIFINGYMFSTSNSDKAFQARANGFGFSKLKPYHSWEALKEEAQELWNLYVTEVNPISVTRLAVRYINRFELPNSGFDFSEYILTTPDIALGIPQGLDDFYMRLVIPHIEQNATAIVTQTSDPFTEDINIYPLIFDIDVFKLVTLEPNSAQIWETLEELRNIKNNIFFKSITDKTKELIK